MLNYFKKIPRHTWILLAIVVVGIFLRTYNFHDWLQFRSDQNRDAYRVDQVISGESSWPLMGPSLNHTGPTEDTSFHVGPIYYYFQILSAKIFGNYPDKLAYPDVFFSILSIPLFFFFLNIYFSKSLSLGITGLYSISAYIIRYSRFAWSCNPIPFFVLLFLVSLFKLLEKNEKTSWLWVAALGIALGVGFQLHAITMIVFSIVTFLAFLFSMKKNYRVWKRWALVLLIFFALNVTQVISEIQTNFANTKILLNSSSQKSTTQKNILTSMENDIDCHIEANFLYLSSYDSSFERSNCSHDFSKIFSGDLSNIQTSRIQDKINIIVLLLVSFLFSLSGYLLLVYYNRQEKEGNKKYFLHLLLAYIGIGFLIMLPLSDGNTNDLRYFSFVFFVPFIFLGFFVKFIRENFQRKGLVILIIATVFILVAISNINAISSATALLLNKGATCSGSTILGEIEPIVDYMANYSGGQKKIYFWGKTTSITFDSLEYLLKKQNIDSMKIGNEKGLPATNDAGFYITCGRLRGIEDVFDYQKIGQNYIYKLKN